MKLFDNGKVRIQEADFTFAGQNIFEIWELESRGLNGSEQWNFWGRLSAHNIDLAYELKIIKRRIL